MKKSLHEHKLQILLTWLEGSVTVGLPSANDSDAVRLPSKGKGCSTTSALSRSFEKLLGCCRGTICTRAHREASAEASSSTSPPSIEEDDEEEALSCVLLVLVLLSLSSTFSSLSPSRTLPSSLSFNRLSANACAVRQCGPETTFPVVSAAVCTPLFPEEEEVGAAATRRAPALSARRSRRYKKNRYC